MNRLNKLSDRRTDPLINSAKLINEVYRSLEQSDAVKYTLGAIQPIDPEYTRATYAEGDRVLNQLEKQLVDKCEYRYQGSVTNDTHIKARSDIDLLTITGKYITLEAPQTPTSPYKGDCIQDLTDLRNNEIDILNRTFPEAQVDVSSSKAISIEGGSLRRKIDVVPSNWFDTNKYAETKDETFRGVQIFDTHTNERIKNTPFLHNHFVDQRDKAVNGNLRKVARLMKSLKYDTDAVDLSSYDIVGIAYNMGDDLLGFGFGHDLALLESSCQYCERLLNDAYLRESLIVPDGHRKVFVIGHATKEALMQMTQQLFTLRDDVISENSRSFQKLQDARVVF